MSLDEFIRQYSNEDIERVTEAIFFGEVSVEQETQLRDALSGLTTAELRRLISEREAAEGLLEELGIEVPVEEVPTLTEAEQAAIRDIQHLLERTGGRGVDYYTELADALESGDAARFAGVTQETLDELPDAERRELAADAEETARELGAEQLTANDFPRVEEATERASGRTIADYWQPLKDELEENGPYPILKEEGVSDAKLEKLKLADEARETFISRINQNIAGIRENRGGSTRSGIETGTLNHENPEDFELPEEGPEEGEEGVPARAFGIVPDRTRVNPITGDEWTASEEEYELEVRFMAFVLAVRGRNSRWSTFDFELPPAERDISMKQWTRLNTKNDPSAKQDAQRFDLPADWIA